MKLSSLFIPALLILSLFSQAQTSDTLEWTVSRGDKEAGISSKEVLKMVTVTAATIAGQAGQFGRIAKGMPADLLIIDGDPVANIEDIRRVEWTIIDHNYFKTKDLLEAISIGYFK